MTKTDPTSHSFETHALLTLAVMSLPCRPSSETRVERVMCVGPIELNSVSDFVL